MNRKQPSTKWMDDTVLVAWAAFFLFLLASHRLPLYINPRFTILPAIGAALLIAMLVARTFGRHKLGHSHPIDWPIAMWNVLPIILGLAIAPASLGAFVANKSGNVISGQGNNSIMLDLASSSQYKEVTVCQLERAGHISKGKVKVEGQIPGQLMSTSQNECPLYHYVMTCCVADLSVASVTLKYPAGYVPKPGQWVRVMGTADRVGPEVVVQADTIENISEPNPPYLY